MEQTEYKKQRCTIWLTKEAVRKSDAGMVQEELPTRSDYIEQAIHESVSGKVKTSENRLARLLFKIAVEMAKLEQILVTINEIGEETLRRLHIRCMNDVKRITGIFSMEDGVEFQGGK